MNIPSKSQSTNDDYHFNRPSSEESNLEMFQSFNSDGVNVVPMLTQQNKSLQDMVKNCQTELNNLREFSRAEIETYERRIQDLQDEIKENRKLTANISDDGVVDQMPREVSLSSHNVDINDF